MSLHTLTIFGIILGLNNIATPRDKFVPWENKMGPPHSRRHKLSSDSVEWVSCR